MHTLSIEDFRSFLVRYHFLDNYERLSGKEGIRKLLQRIGSIQYDPLNVVGRNPDLVLQSRIKNYTGKLLDELLYKDRVLLDEWDKEMSIYLTRDWSNFHRIRKVREETALRTLKHRGQEEVLSYFPQIMEELKTRGPSSARDLKLGAIQKNRWGHRQVSGAALDYLYTAGKLGIYKKSNAQKIYDFIENLIPESLLNKDDPFSTEDDFFEWYFLRRIRSLGAYWLRNGSGWLGFYLSDSGLRKKTLGILEEKKLIAPIKISGLDEVLYICKKDISVLGDQNNYDGFVRLLAPLDNMLWDRLLVKRIFNFEYSWEVYAPQNKRKYGYYVLPLLYRNNLIARIELFKYEKGKALIVKNLWWENSINKNDTELKDAVKKGLENFANYLEADGVDKKSLEKALKARNPPSTN